MSERRTYGHFDWLAAMGFHETLRMLGTNNKSIIIISDGKWYCSWMLEYAEE